MNNEQVLINIITNNLPQFNNFKNKTKQKRRDLKIVFLDVGPNTLEGLGSGNLGLADEVLHLRGDFFGFHDTANFATGGWRLRDGGGSNYSEWSHPQRRRRRRSVKRKPWSPKS